MSLTTVKGTILLPKEGVAPLTFEESINAGLPVTVSFATFDRAQQLGEVGHFAFRRRLSTARIDDEASPELSLDARERATSLFRTVPPSPSPSPGFSQTDGSSGSPTFPRGSPATPSKGGRRQATESSPRSSPSSPRTVLEHEAPARIVEIYEREPPVTIEQDTLTCCLPYPWLQSSRSISRSSVAPLGTHFQITDSARDEKDLFKLIQSHRNLVSYRGIPESDLYKLFIDQKRWAGNPGRPDDPVFKTRMTFDVREPGYLRAMKKTFSYLMQFPKGYFLWGNNLNEIFLEKLHEMSIDGVQTHEGILLRSKYRLAGDQVNEGFRLTSQQAASLRQIEDGVTPGITITPEGAVEFFQKMNAPEYFYRLPGDDSKFHAIADALTKDCRKKFKAFNSTREISALPDIITLQFIRTGASIKPLVNQLIFVFKQLPKETEDQKLKAIARFIQDLDQIHPFYDGNIRVFAILLINRLLFDLNLLPTCLEDPNCFDCLSLDQLIDAIKKGQKHFASLKKPWYSKFLWNTASKA